MNEGAKMQIETNRICRTVDHRVNDELQLLGLNAFDDLKNI